MSVECRGEEGREKERGPPLVVAAAVDIRRTYIVDCYNLYFNNVYYLYH